MKGENWVDFSKLTTLAFFRSVHSFHKPCQFLFSRPPYAADSAFLSSRSDPPPYPEHRSLPPVSGLQTPSPSDGSTAAVWAVWCRHLPFVLPGRDELCLLGLGRVAVTLARLNKSGITSWARHTSHRPLRTGIWTDELHGNEIWLRGRGGAGKQSAFCASLDDTLSSGIRRNKSLVWVWFLFQVNGQRLVFC